MLFKKKKKKINVFFNIKNIKFIYNLIKKIFLTFNSNKVINSLNSKVIYKKKTNLLKKILTIIDLKKINFFKKLNKQVHFIINNYNYHSYEFTVKKNIYNYIFLNKFSARSFFLRFFKTLQINNYQNGEDVFENVGNIQKNKTLFYNA